MSSGPEKIEGAVNQLLKLWESGELPEYVRQTVIRRLEGSRPSDSWSVGNQILMLVSGTDDARGFKQWQEAGRKVVKGARALYILGPVTRKVTEENGAGEKETRQIVTGFRPIPVFAIEDTEGAAVESADYQPAEVPPLMEVAQAWGIPVTYVPSAGRYLGFYDPERDRIVLATHEQKTFFHELAHAAHARLTTLKAGQVASQEIVAETVAAVLCLIYGLKAEFQTGARSYVAGYAGVEPAAACKGVMRCLTEIHQVLELILTTAEQLGRPGEPGAAQGAA